MNPTQSQPAALPKHTPATKTYPQRRERIALVVQVDIWHDSKEERRAAISEAIENVCSVRSLKFAEPLRAKLLNQNPALVAENKRLREALEDCNGVLDSINRQLGGKSVAVRAVLDKARAALAKEDV